jgi:nicotinic acid mononucleotide adenylyltransferase
MVINDDREVSVVENHYLMTVIATASNPWFTVSRVDIDRHGPTYYRTFVILTDDSGVDVGRLR